MARTGEAQTAPGFREPSRCRAETASPCRTTPIGTGGAWLTLDTLLEVPRPGEEGSWRSFASSRAIAWKTGTSFGLRDGWAVGTTSRYTVGVWVGNASGEGRPGLTGSTMAAPLMFGLFNGLPASAWFDRPAYALRAIEVCENDGYLATADCTPNASAFRSRATSMRSRLTTCACISTRAAARGWRPASRRGA